MTMLPRKELTLLDSICIIVGIIIGAGIYETAPTVAACMGSPVGTVFIWVFGGLMALIGAANYAELATAYPKAGGDYVYLTRAYGRPVGFLFGWSQLILIRPGDIALMAFIFSRYASQIVSFPYAKTVYAVGSIVLLSGLNILGVRQGKWTQNILTVLKVVGLAFLIAAGFLWPQAGQEAAAQTTWPQGFSLALILVLFTYGGWNEMAYVAAEVKNPNRNIIRSLTLGTVAVMLLYVLMNAAFLSSLGFTRLSQSNAVAADLVSEIFHQNAGKIISGLICISALGAVNGLIFTGARISYAVGQDHALFSRLSRWNSEKQGPTRSLVLQMLLSVAIVLFAGSFVDTIIYTAPAVWLFFLAAGGSAIILRLKEPDVVRPWKMPLFPLMPILFALICGFMLYSCIAYAWSYKPAGLLVSIGILSAGGVVYTLSERTGK